jgi:acetyl-CoA synthetase
MTAKYALDLHPRISSGARQIGWVTGASYGIFAPWLTGQSIVDEADFDAERWYRILQEQR